MKTAVTTIGIGKERVFNEHFLAMMNHYLVEPVACTPASGWEKGQVERQVKTLRKRLFEPTLSFENLEALNHYLAKQCHELMNAFKHPDNKSITVLQSLYQEQAKIIEKQECVAVHIRRFVKNETSYNPWHYLTALKQKPGALRNGESFLHWKLPESIKTLQQHLLKKPKGDRAMVELLHLIAEYGEDVGITAAEIALEEKIPTVEAVHNIIHRLLEPVPPTLKIKDIPLTTQPQSNCLRYNTLLTGVNNATS